METKTEIHRTDKSKGEIKMSFYQLGFYSKILEKDTDVLVAAPEKLDTDCKVVYLLHGGGGGGKTDNKSWLNQKEELQKWAEEYQIVFIMPSAPDSFFANTCTGIRYQDYMLEEVTVKMPEILRISKSRLQTAVAGMSMGGTSAFRLGMAAPERFGAIGCLSSGNLWMSPISNTVHAYAVKNVFGVERIEDIEGTEYDFFVDALRNIRENRPLPKIFHVCGKQDHALVHAQTTAAWFQNHAKEYDYTYYEPEQGGHGGAFWGQWFPKFFRFFSDLQNNA